MKQVTGNNPQRSANKVSIRLAPGGHSFSEMDLTAARLAEEVSIEVLTPRTMLVPAEVFRPGDADEAACAETGRELLAANGTPLAENECAVWSTSEDGIAAVMAVEAETFRILRETLGGRAQFTTPLLYVPLLTEATVWMYYTEELVYTKVYEGQLRMAEVISAPTEADVLYFAELLGREFPLGKYCLHLIADDPKPLRKLIGKRFKKTTTENPK